MEKIKALYLNSTKNSVHFNFMDFVMAAVTKFGLDDGPYKKYITVFREAFAAEDDVYQRYDRKTLTARIHKANTDRAIKVQLLREVLTAIRKTAAEERRLAAERLLGVVDLYGGGKIHRLPMDEISGVLTNMLEDFVEKYPEDIEMLGIDGEVENLRAANEEFKRLMSERTHADSELGKAAMVNARAETDRCYHMLVTAINLDVEFGCAEEPLANFIAYLNTEVDRYRVLIGQGTGRGAVVDDDEMADETIVTFKLSSGNQVRIKAPIGSIFEAPLNTPGHRFEPLVPEHMPAQNTTYKEVEDE